MKNLKSLHTINDTSEKLVEITYILKKSVHVNLLDNGFSIGYVNIDLEHDQDEDPNHFSSKEDKKYYCLMEEKGIQVTLYASGKTGDYWTLEIYSNGKPLATNPVKVETDHNGHLDYDELIN